VSRASFEVTTLLRVEVAIVEIDKALAKTSSTACSRVQYPSAVCNRIMYNVLILGGGRAHSCVSFCPFISYFRGVIRCFETEVVLVLTACYL
jgi:hypothetical protein